MNQTKIKCYHYLSNIISTESNKPVLMVGTNKSNMLKLIKAKGFQIKLFKRIGKAREYYIEMIEETQFEILSKGLREGKLIIDDNINETNIETLL